jgi:hypothetical protein
LKNYNTKSTFNNTHLTLSKNPGGGSMGVTS